MNRLSVEKRARVIECLCEGNSLRATSRICDVAINTVMALTVNLGAACKKFHDEKLQGLSCSEIQCDEMWLYVYAREPNVTHEMREHHTHVGDTYLWVAIDPTTKLVPCWHVGCREISDAMIFMENLASRLVSRVQMSTDGFRAYPTAIAEAFGGEIDYGWLVKSFAEGLKSAEEKRTTKPLEGIRGSAVFGNPDPTLISTSIVERQNLTVRMSLRRAGRLTNAFSKKFENLVAAMNVHYVYYNFVRIHKSLRVTPAMAHGLTNRVWSYEDIARLAD